MAELKTKKNKESVNGFLKSVEDEKSRKDSIELLKIFRKITGENGNMWGSAIIGFGDYHYKYKSGREGDWFRVGFSPRKQAISIYLMSEFEGKKKLLDNLGKHKTGVGCLYIKKLEDVNLKVLEKLIEKSFKSDIKTC